MALEVLGNDNYTSWSASIRDYLLAHNLSDVVETTRERRADGKNQDYLKYASFLKAVRNGDLDAMKAFLALHPEASSAKLTFGDQTALHIAVLAGHVHIVKELVERIMSNETLEMQDVEGYTALARATSSGDFRMIQCMIDKNPKLVSIPEKSVGSIPVVISMCFDSKELSRYLYRRTPLMDLEPEKGHHGASLISFAIYTLTLDIAVDLIRRRPNLAFAIDREQRSPLYVLASTPDAFPSGKKFVFWKRWIYSWIHIRPSRATAEIRVNIQNLQEKTNRTSARALFQQLDPNLLSVFKQLSEMKLLHAHSHELLSRMCKPISNLNAEARSKGGVYAAIFRAIKEGNFEFVYEIVRANPDLLYVIEFPTKRTIFMLAVLHRQAKIFSLIYGLQQIKTSLSGSDTSYNNILHIAGIFTESTPIQHIPGAALQMQRELQWFKEVERLSPPMLQKALNSGSLTPRQLFTRNHEELMKKGEEWMKNTASSCTVVGALIVTIMFAAAFTVPGGNDQNTGLPMFLDKKVFILFVIFDSLSLFSSSASVLMFLGILTARYAEDDFLKSLPKKMIIGLFALFFSITTMMVAFSATLLIMLRGKSSIVLPIICLASLPVTLFVLMQFPLLVDMTMSTYGPGIFKKKMERWV
ncbi:hypothetical protein CJ030_MR1G020811 [Morella rubra]|uniref:PGG domain-containing protein n=1 Tax=Morella rubra TaxID=262757 RepID=A0A6A1WM43_9ROSI|nr:hypothetical protein CJ030_MR1G020811 [Morella rubra]